MRDIKKEFFNDRIQQNPPFQYSRQFANPFISPISIPPMITDFHFRRMTISTMVVSIRKGTKKRRSISWIDEFFSMKMHFNVQSLKFKRYKMHFNYVCMVSKQHVWCYINSSKIKRIKTILKIAILHIVFSIRTTLL